MIGATGLPIKGRETLPSGLKASDHNPVQAFSPPLNPMNRIGKRLKR